ncbi:unnamed protein product [Paramecium primaurelia]|uniref:Uncharacterized protein n=2 Tax=Paramecium TaxID=5884 RepID=A0A8S1UCW7_9CILI|nr:unnamed protein product [Paramecium primaurelia]CAD8161589.1 unnamed protein product [Paramecium pentaurelia]
MRKSQKMPSQQQMKNIITPTVTQQITYSPELSPINKPQKQMTRKTSMIELYRVESESIRIRPQRVLQIIKDAKQQLFSQQNPRNEKKLKPRVETSEGQNRGLDFTFAQNFSNKQIIMKEFSSNGLRKKFFV